MHLLLEAKNFQFFCVCANTHVKFEDTPCLFKGITRSKFGHVRDENYRSYRILVQIITKTICKKQINIGKNHLPYCRHCPDPEIQSLRSRSVED